MSGQRELPTSFVKNLMVCCFHTIGIRFDFMHVQEVISVKHFLGADLVNKNRWGTTWIKKKWLVDW
jgi:hypothetical protein